MKKTNKGFSLVELIIVIAIMAILAGALAPQLVKYINKSRLSSDIQTGASIASAVNAALAGEASYDAAAASYDTTTTTMSAITGANGQGGAADAFATEVRGALGTSNGQGKAKKDIDGGAINNQDFFLFLDLQNNVVEVYYGVDDHTGNKDYLCSPTAGAKLTK